MFFALLLAGAVLSRNVLAATVKPTICAADDPGCKPVTITPVGDANYVDCVSKPGSQCVAGNNIVAQAPFDPLSACPTDQILGGTTSLQDINTQIAVCVNAVRETPDAFACLYPCPYDFRTEVTQPPRGGLTFTGTAPVAELQSMATRHSLDMATNDYFAHTGSDNSTLADRATDAGFDTFPLGENIAAGYNSVRDVVLAWMCSPGHRTNLMACGFDSVGTSAEVNLTSDYKIYYTQDFGCSRDDWNCQCPSIINATSGAAPVLPPLAACPTPSGAPASVATAPASSPISAAMETPAPVPALPQTNPLAPAPSAASPVADEPAFVAVPTAPPTAAPTPTEAPPVAVAAAPVPASPQPAAPMPATLSPAAMQPLVAMAPVAPPAPLGAPSSGCLYVTSMEVSGMGTQVPAATGDSALIIAVLPSGAVAPLQVANVSLALANGGVGNVASVQQFPAQPQIFLIQIYHPRGYTGSVTVAVSVSGVAPVSYQVVDRPLYIQPLGFDVAKGTAT